MLYVLVWLLRSCPLPGVHALVPGLVGILHHAGAGGMLLVILVYSHLCVRISLYFQVHVVNANTQTHLLCCACPLQRFAILSVRDSRSLWVERQ